MKFGIASASLLPLPLRSVIKKAKRAGFDFVEVFLFGGWTREKVDYFQSFAERLHLSLHFHQLWTTESSAAKEKVLHRTLTALGLLPPEEYDRNEWIPTNARPLVAYAEEVVTFAEQNGVWFQSIAGQRSLTDRSPRLSCLNFLRTAGERNLPIVFDTMHFIEYVRNESGIEHSPLTERAVFGEWQTFWENFSPQVKEIHFNDFTKKRNLWPGTGSAPLQDFATMVKMSGWDGCVVPEVQPKLPFPYGGKELLQLRKETEKYFA